MMYRRSANLCGPGEAGECAEELMTCLYQLQCEQWGCEQRPRNTGGFSLMLELQPRQRRRPWPLSIHAYNDGNALLNTRSEFL